jgi:hypothetical protein
LFSWTLVYTTGTPIKRGHTRVIFPDRYMV